MPRSLRGDRHGMAGGGGRRRIQCALMATRRKKSRRENRIASVGSRNARHPIVLGLVYMAGQRLFFFFKGDGGT